MKPVAEPDEIVAKDPAKRKEEECEEVRTLEKWEQKSKRGSLSTADSNCGG